MFSKGLKKTSLQVSFNIGLCRENNIYYHETLTHARFSLFIVLITRYGGLTSVERRFLKDHDYYILRSSNTFAYESLINGGNENTQMPICMFIKAETNAIGVDCEQSRFSDFSYEKVHTEVISIDTDCSPMWNVTDLCKFY